MPDMSFAEARIALEQFARAHRASIRLGEALETADSLERQTAMLQNNVEHLLKEQAAQQKNLDAMTAEAADRTERLKKKYADLEGELENLRRAHEDKLRDDRSKAEAAKVAEDAKFAEYVKAHGDEMAAMQAQKKALEAELASLNVQAEAIKQKMRKFVG